MARLLMIVSSARSIDLVSDKEHPTGYFADEVLKPYDKFMTAGVEVKFATVNGAPPQADPYGLKRPVVLLLVLPVLILYLSETLGGDCRYPAGVVSTLVWAVAEKERLRTAKSPDTSAPPGPLVHLPAQSA
jgi:putative intracellular protease/amidase